MRSRNAPLARLTEPWRRATAARRTLPDFMIIGAARAGTTSLYVYLAQHPDVRVPVRKEINFFDQRFALGPDWYRAQFPLGGAGRRWKTGEATPYYLHHPRVPERVRETVPDVRLVVLLRDPVERAFSHYRLLVRRTKENRSFAQIVDEELTMIERTGGLVADDADNRRTKREYAIVDRGRYAEQLERWLAVFPRDQLLVLRSEVLFGDPVRTYARALEFVGLAPFGDADFRARNASTPATMDDGVRERLTAFYAPSNQRVRELVGIDLEASS
ncbi:MAG: sulfotransferase family protein [Actinomycetia bacterium]|nr:sulfotransferase family protein [Actinomycetes bacterium]